MGGRLGCKGCMARCMAGSMRGFTTFLILASALAALVAAFVLMHSSFAAGEPFVWLYSPNESYYNTTTLNLLYTSSDDVAISETWYNYTAGNITLSGNTTIEGTEGSNNITLWASDTSDNQNDTVPFTVNIDTQPPNTTVDNASGSTIPYRPEIWIQGTCHDDGIAGLSYAYTNSSYFSVPESLSGSDGIFNISNSSAISQEPQTVYVFCNDSYGNNLNFSEFTFTLGANAYLDISLVTPPDGALVPHISLFEVNATVVCEGESCGNVNAKLMYNVTTDYPDADVPASDSSPFYIMGSPNQQGCFYNPLSGGQFCNITWKVNASGAVGSSYKLAAVFQSDSTGVDRNQTENNTVQIASCFVANDIYWSYVDFGGVNPGVTVPAPGNSNSIYNMSSNSSCITDFYVKGINLTSETDPSYNISVGNLVWSNQSDTYDSGVPLDYGWLPVNSSVWPGINNTQYFWLKVPWGIVYGKYEGNITVEVVESGTNP
jgi:hypothetical protein